MPPAKFSPIWARRTRRAITRSLEPGARLALRLRAAGALLLGLALLGDAWPTHAEGPAPQAGLRHKQAIRTERLDIRRPAGLTHVPGADLFVVLPLPGEGGEPAPPAVAALMDRFGDPVGSLALPLPLTAVSALAYDGHGRRLLVLDLAGRTLHAIPVAAAGGFDPTRASRLPAPRVGLLRPAGMAVDPGSGEVFVLDRLSRRILRFTPAGESPGAPEARWMDLGPLAPLDVRGLAFDPQRGHLFTVEPARRIVHEITTDGLAVAAYVVPSLSVDDPRSLVFAPSGDQTDEPSTLSLFIADPGTPESRRGHVLEAAWTMPQADVTAETSTSATLVKVTETSKFSPPSPDPTGIAYDSATGRLVISDAEVDEWSIWAGKNVWETSLGGSLARSYGVSTFTNEPCGVAYDAANRQLYFVDDDADKVFVVSPGSDNVFGTSDDTRRSFTTRDFNSTDAEGVAYDRVNKRLFIADGVNEEIYVLRPGPNGIFDGVPPTGDDQVTHFDTTVLGVLDPETVEYKEDTGTLLLIRSTGTPIVKEVTTTGSLVSQIDLSFAPLKRHAGMAYAPTSNNPSGRSLYILNAGTWHANDGTLVEVALGGSGPSNTAPVVNAGPDQTIALPSSASLDGTVTDDGLPNPPGAVTCTWSKVSGPGAVTFQDANAVDTQASFSDAGTYVLRLTASDGSLSASDEVQITVQSPGGTVVERRIAAGSDDAEESATGVVTLNSSDLELVFDGSNQKVGLRFTNVAVARNANIATAWIQFAADEVHNEPTNLVIRGQAADSAPTFVKTTGDISSRALTTDSVTWSPAAWNTVGEAGPNQRTPELKSVIQAIVNRPGWTSGNALAIIISGTGHRTAESYEGSVATAALLHIEVASGNTAPVVNAGPDQTVVLPASASLDGTVSDDGLPGPPASLTTTWTVASGPGPVTFQDPNAVDTQASFTTAGIYVLTLTANDGALSSSDQVQITVQTTATNTAPVVNAGPDQFIALPADAVLDGTVSDDGQPVPPGAVTTTWSKVSGPGTVTFQDASAVDTRATFSAPGVYVLRLTASDGGLTASDPVQITVDPAGILERRIAAGTDDAEENASLRVSLNSTDIELVYDRGNQTVGLRFTQLTIPPRATITSAYVQFMADEATSETTTVLIQAQAAGNPGTFVKANADISGRPRTTASVSWTPPPWTQVGEAGLNQRTANLAPVIQEIVNRSDYAVGSALVLIMTGSGRRVAEALEGQPAGAALLRVEYR